MDIRGILFDLDGTLANTLPLCVKSYKHAFEQLSGRPYTEEEVTAHFGATEEGIFQRVLPEQWEEGIQLYYRLYEQFQADCPAPFPDIETALQLLKQRGVKLAIVTGRGRYNTLRTLDYLGLSSYFDIVEVGDAKKVIKLACIQRILAQWNIAPEQAAYVGDTVTDMQEAIAARVLPLGAAWAETSTLHQLQTDTPVTTFTTVEQCVHWIQEHVDDRRLEDPCGRLISGRPHN